MARRFVGLKEYQAEVASLPTRVRDLFDRENHKAADEVIALATQRVPVEDGDLRASIKKRTDAVREVSVIVSAGEGEGSASEHAGVTEFGSQDDATPAQPYFFSSVRTVRRRSNRRRQRNLRKLLRGGK